MDWGTGATGAATKRRATFSHVLSWGRAVGPLSDGKVNADATLMETL